VVEGGDTHTELSHGVQSLREATEMSASLGSRTDSLWQDVRVNKFLDKLGELSTFRKLIGEGANLFWGRNLPSEQEPEHALGNDLLAIGGCGELFLAIWNGQSVEADPLVAYLRRWVSGSI
jgi:hypothetical protein